MLVEQEANENHEDQERFDWSKGTVKTMFPVCFVASSQQDLRAHSIDLNTCMPLFQPKKNTLFDRLSKPPLSSRVLFFPRSFWSQF